MAIDITEDLKKFDPKIKGNASIDSEVSHEIDCGGVRVYLFKDGTMNEKIISAERYTPAERAAMYVKAYNMACIIKSLKRIGKKGALSFLRPMFKVHSSARRVRAARRSSCAVSHVSHDDGGGGDDGGDGQSDQSDSSNRRVNLTALSFPVPFYISKFRRPCCGMQHGQFIVLKIHTVPRVFSYGFGSP